MPVQVPDLSGGEDPDDAFSRVPYEKGFYFLWYLQVRVVGGGGGGGVSIGGDVECQVVGSLVLCCCAMTRLA